MKMITWCLISFVIGLIVGTIGSYMMVKNDVKMYRTLWENEKNGNYLLTKRITKMEEDLSDF